MLWLSDAVPADRGDSFSDVDVRKAAVAHHNAAYAVVLALKKFDVRREVLRHKIVVRKADHGHLLVRVGLRRAYTGKVFETTNYSVSANRGGRR